jgi:4-oxalocrotonate tautomerase
VLTNGRSIAAATSFTIPTNTCVVDPVSRRDGESTQVFCNPAYIKERQMAMISLDMRYGRTEEQKRKLAAGFLRVISEATGETKDDFFFVIREGHGINFVEQGEHLPDYVDGNLNDKELVNHLK